MKVRVRFTKEGNLRYLGHLDIMRYFQKAIRRADIDIAYSQGFNPHQILSFASPLGLGMTSEGEYFDAEFNSSEDSEIMLNKLNAVMVPGICCTSYKVIPDGNKYNAMASLYAASYELSLYDSVTCDIEKSGCVNELWNTFLSQNEIIITKQTKKNLVDVDIKQMMINCDYADGTFSLFLNAGSAQSLKPITVIDSFLKFANYDKSAEELFIEDELKIRRIDQFTLEGENIVSLSQVGELV